jgi:hypothetical protein
MVRRLQIGGDDLSLEPLGRSQGAGKLRDGVGTQEQSCGRSGVCRFPQLFMDPRVIAIHALGDRAIAERVQLDRQIAAVPSQVRSTIGSQYILRGPLAAGL